MNGLPEKRGQSPFVRSTHRAVPANGDCPLFSVPPLNDELAGLLESLCLEELSTTDAARLEELVSSDPDCCRQYIVFMQMHALAERFAGKWQADSSSEGNEEIMQSRKAFELPCSDDFIPESPSPFSLSPLPSPLFPSSVGGWAFSYVVASVVLCLMLLGGWAYKITRFDQSADNCPKTTAPGVDAQFVSVGQVSGMKDCVWVDEGAGTMVGASVPMGREYALASGLLEITYTSGARVILEGPCGYKVDSDAGGYLKQGKLTARIGERGEGRGESAKPQAANPESRNSSRIPYPSSFFTVTTPTAVVTDLGTEFGVEVDDAGNTTSHVFQGSVEVKWAGGAPARLDAGESVMVSRACETHNDQATSESVRVTHPATSPKFVRRMHEPPKLLDLVDVVAGGDGTGMNRERGLDPASGRFDAVFSTGYPKDEHQYHRVNWPRFVDGVFIPLGGEEPVQVDSAGHTFALPATSGDTFGTIWARSAEVRRKDLADEKYYWVYSMGDAERFMPKMRGILCLHANAGITFNLKAVRQAFPGSTPSGFTAVAGMADAGRFAPDACGQADLWVFVDGRLKWKRIGLRTQDGLAPIDVEFGPNARFLTLVSTDGGNESACDWVVFGDPVLDLTSPQLEEAQTMKH